MYNITVAIWENWKTEYPFALNTEADQIPLKFEELVQLRDKCNEAISRYQSIEKEIPE